MGAVGWLAQVSMQHAVLMALIASLPGLFIGYTVRRWFWHVQTFNIQE
jgi:hypothetical protein